MLCNDFMSITIFCLVSCIWMHLSYYISLWIKTYYVGSSWFVLEDLFWRAYYLSIFNFEQYILLHFALWNSQEFPYVIPSVPQTGSYICGHNSGHTSDTTRLTVKKAVEKRKDSVSNYTFLSFLERKNGWCPKHSCLWDF